MNHVLEQHRQELIETFGLEDVAKEKQDDLIGRIGEVFLKHIFSLLLISLEIREQENMKNYLIKKLV